MQHWPICVENEFQSRQLKVFINERPIAIVFVIINTNAENPVGKSPT